MPDAAPQTQKTNSLAILSLIFAFIFPLISIVLGIVSLNQIKKSKEGGKGLAVAGIVISAIFFLILGLIVLAGIIAGIKDAKDKTTSTTSTNSTQSAVADDGTKNYRFAERADKQAKDIEVAAGETATIDSVKMTVKSVDYKTSLSDYETAGTGKTYVVADVLLENTESSTHPYNVYDFRIQTAGGQVLDGSYGTLTNPLNSGDLVTGGKVEGQIVFEVPVESGHQYIIWKPGFDSTRAIVQAQ